jgi:hypothetical protein
MKRHSALRQVFEDSLNVMLRPTRSTDVDVREMEANNFIHELEDLLSR